jgi:hypothetical protein
MGNKRTHMLRPPNTLLMSRHRCASSGVLSLLNSSMTFAGFFSLQTKKAQSKKTPIKKKLALPLKESCALYLQSKQIFII